MSRSRTSWAGGLLGLSVLGLVAACGDDAPGEDPDACEGMEDVAPKQAVIWRFVNATDVPIYLPASEICNSDRVAYELFGPDDTRVNAEDAPCEGSCEQRTEPPAACNESCLSGPARRLEPGAVYEHTWDGGIWADDRRAPGCFADDAATQSKALDEAVDADHVSCARRAIAPEGPYRLELVAWAACSTGLGEECLCEPEAPGGACEIPSAEGPRVSGEALPGVEDFYPVEGGVVEIRYEGDLCVTPGDPCDQPGVTCCPDEECVLDEGLGELLCQPR